MRIESVGPDIEIAIGETYESSSTIFYRGDEVVLVDAMASRADAADLREHLSGRMVRFIIATHYFSDHIAGLELFPEALIIAHRNHAQVFESELFRTDEEATFFVPPGIVVRDGLSVRWGRHTLNVFENCGHTLGTLNVDVPEADLVLSGDNLVGNIVYLAYSSPDLIAGALQELDRRGRSRLISSHGGLGRGERLGKALSYLSNLGEAARSAWKGGAGLVRNITLDQCLAPGVAGTSFEEIFHTRNLQVICERNLFCQA